MGWDEGVIQKVFGDYVELRMPLSICTAMTKHLRLVNLYRTEIYCLTVLEAGRSKIKTPESGQDHVTALAYGGT